MFQPLYVILILNIHILNISIIIIISHCFHFIQYFILLYSTPSLSLFPDLSLLSSILYYCFMVPSYISVLLRITMEISACIFIVLSWSIYFTCMYLLCSCIVIA